MYASNQKASLQALYAAKYKQASVLWQLAQTTARRACYAIRSKRATRKTKEIHKCFGYSVSH